jgi:hypothetical protein
LVSHVPKYEQMSPWMSHASPFAGRLPGQVPASGGPASGGPLSMQSLIAQLHVPEGSQEQSSPPQPASSG